MEPLRFASAKEAREYIEERDCHSVKLGVFDIDGVLRGKYVSKSKFLSVLDKGFGFCDVVLGWDSNDQLYDNVKFTGWHTGYPDASVRVLPETGRHLPLEDGVLFLGEFVGEAEKVCPRGVLRRVIEKARAMGFEPFGALEYEFFMFKETPDSIREKGYRNLTPWTPGNFGYSVLRNSVHSDFYDDLLHLGVSMDFEIEGLHTETGPGVLEAAIGVDQVLAMVASTVNSYTRLIPGFWAPTNPTWGVENRTCALRVVPGSQSSQRLEYRVAAADANPYLALAAALMSGLHGIEKGLEPTEMVVGNAYDKPQDPETALPTTLWQAAQRLKACQVARDMLGDEFVDHFAATREWEEREFRKHITDWELQRYFEII